MTRLSNVKRIITEDFEPQYQTLISRLGFVLNEFMSDTVDIVNGNIDFDNLAQNLLSFEVTVNSSGVPLKSTDINVSKNNPQGIQVIRVQALTATNTFPTSTPFVSYTPKGNNIVSVSNISGLQPNIKYKVTVIVY